MPTDLFIQKMTARSERRGKMGSTRRMLGIPKGETIPFTWLEKIARTPLGKRCRNPTKIGFRSVKVTPLLKRIGQRR
jgi:hypothetical protein